LVDIQKYKENTAVYRIIQLLPIFNRRIW